MNVNEVAEALGVRPAMIHKLVRENRISCIEVTPRNRRFVRADITEYLASRRRTLPKKVDSAPRPQVISTPKTHTAEETRAQIKEDLRSW